MQPQQPQHQQQQANLHNKASNEGLVNGMGSTGHSAASATSHLAEAPSETPRFVKEISGQLEVEEGDAVHMETAVAPAGDNSMQVQWLKDGVPLSAGSRFNSVFDRGIVALDILYTFAEDAGAYSCLVTSKSGSAQSVVANVRVAAEQDVITNTQLPEQEMMQKIVDLESSWQAASENTEREDRHRPKEAPKFTKAPTAQVQVNEGEPLEVEVRLTPETDSTLHVEWIKDGNSLNTGSRFNMISDRGVCILGIAYCIPEDSGQYVCVARNALGEACSSPMQLSCIGGATIVTDSHMQEGSEGYKRILEMEEEMNRNDDDNFRHLEQVEVDSAPLIDIPPVAAYAGEGGPAKFLARVSGHPTPEVQWFLNEEPIHEDSLHKVYNDGAICCMEIHRCQILGESAIRLIAKNALGQTEAVTQLNVVPMEDFRPDLKHVAPENTFKKMMSLKKVEVTPELDNKLRKSKPSAETILMMEKEGNMRHQLYKCPDVANTEQLYDQIASKLKKHPSHGKKEDMEATTG